MRGRLLLVPLAAALASPPAAYATTYLTTEQAQSAMFPGARLTPEFRALTDEQIAAIRRDCGINPPGKELRAWRSSSGGWFIVDRVVGKHEYITLGVGLDDSGAVKGLEILDYRESYGDQVRGSAWRSQFTGKRHGAALKLGQDVKNISGATMSSKHVTEGVRRLLATHAIVLASSSS
jgi:hypothetical protein